MTAESGHPRRLFFPHCPLTAGALPWPPFCRAAEVGRGHRLHSGHCGPLCGLALGRVGHLASRERLVNVAYVVSGVLALALCVYLLYAMFKPEKF
jgi:K+-transporting ATPase KdpF subunit